MKTTIETINFNLKTKLIFGEGEALHLKQHLKDNNIKKPFIVMDNAVFNSRYGAEVLGNIKYKNLLIYSEKEPTYELLEEYRDEPNKTGSKSIIGIGGGSVLDFAKGLAFLSKNKQSALSYRGFPTNTNKPLPIVALSTTAGTGSEVTYNAVFIDSKSNRKLGINTTDNFPTLAIDDPRFLYDCPPKIVISSGMDALIHSLESYSAKQSNLLTKPLSITAFEYILQSLERAAKGKVQSLRTMMLASYIAGVALMNSGSGPTGALSYILGSNFQVPHGIAGATFLPHIIKHNEKNNFDYQHLLNLNQPLSDILFDMCSKLSINTSSLKQFGVKDSNVDLLLMEVENLQPAFNQNPVPYKISDAKKLLREMI